MDKCSVELRLICSLTLQKTEIHNRSKESIGLEKGLVYELYLDLIQDLYGSLKTQENL